MQVGDIKTLINKANLHLKNKGVEIRFYENGFDGRPLFNFSKRHDFSKIKHVYYQCHTESDAAMELKRIMH